MLVMITHRLVHLLNVEQQGAVEVSCRLRHIRINHARLRRHCNTSLHVLLLLDKWLHLALSIDLRVEVDDPLGLMQMRDALVDR